MATATVPTRQKLGQDFIQANIDGVLRYGEKWHTTTHQIAAEYTNRGLNLFDNRNDILNRVASLLEQQDTKSDTTIDHRC